MGQYTPECKFQGIKIKKVIKNIFKLERRSRVFQSERKFIRLFNGRFVSPTYCLLHTLQEIR
jgi:hypothetical protein